MSTMENSSNFTLAFPNTFFRWDLRSLTAASHSRPKCGVRSGINFHYTCWDVQNPALARVDLSSCQSSTFISLSAQTKFVPWSLQIDGIPHRPINLRKVATKVDVVKSDTRSRCTAFVARHTNTATYSFVKRGLRTDPYLL